jgi:branched-subunit amino acid ABC-type transport system permease component
MGWNDTGILFLILLAMMAVLLALLHRTRLGSLLRERISDRPRRRLFLASVSFF